MLLKRNLLETATLISSGGTVICVLLNCVTNISPITGVWFLIYILSLFVASVFLSIRSIQWLLHLNRPLKYDVDGWVEKYPWLSFIRGILPKVKVRKSQEECEYDTNELSIISTVLERRLVSSWYVPYISEEIGFPFACKQLLDQMISKTFQICHKIETKDVYVDLCAILITHLKEYKKAQKRHEKSPESGVEFFYKKTHSIFDPENNLTSADHSVNILRIVLKELVPWELWDTPHSELLIRVLAKKLDNFVDSTLSNPAWLNDKLYMILTNNIKEETVKISTDNNIENFMEKVKNTTEVVKTVDFIEPVPPPETNSEPLPVVSQRPKEEAKEAIEHLNSVTEDAPIGTEAIEIKPNAVLRQRRGRQGRNEVKIYDRIIEGSVKTWETDMDLQCISMGQDLLASLDEMTLSRLWGQEDTEHSPNLRNRSPQPLWFGEEDSVDIELPELEVREVKKENSPKPTDALLKDIQSTVHQAKTKIGDLQVPLDIDVPCKHSSDEAAGMMEGLLDIGIAGIKKGLRFTGLSDDSQEKSPSHQKDKANDKVSPPDVSRGAHSKPAAQEHREASQTAQKEENSNSVPPLVKQHRVISQDSVPVTARAEAPAPLIPLSDSPEPEYEEVADLSTSIARLRSLLQETASASRSDDIWWEGAEETRGRAQRSTSGVHSRPVDTATLADEYDMSGELNSSPRQTSNNMQRLDKLLQRTVTGVFNSIKTAVSAEEEQLLQPVAHWTYVVAGAADASVGSAAARLLGARRCAWHVDAALDSLHAHAQPPRDARARADTPAPDDFEEWCSSRGAAWCAGCAAGSAAGLPRHHVSYRLATLLFADAAESLILAWLDELTAWLRAQVFIVFEQLSSREDPTCEDEDLRPFDPEETCTMLLEKIPGVYIFGEGAMAEAVRLLVSSFSHKEINKDVIFRSFDLFAVHFKKSAALRNPSFDNN